jgi:hypothetical protein
LGSSLRNLCIWQFLLLSEGGLECTGFCWWVRVDGSLGRGGGGGYVEPSSSKGGWIMRVRGRTRVEFRSLELLIETSKVIFNQYYSFRCMGFLRSVVVMMNECILSKCTQISSHTISSNSTHGGRLRYIASTRISKMSQRAAERFHSILFPAHMQVQSWKSESTSTSWAFDSGFC